MEWAYGVTTVPSRCDDLLPKTLASLTKAGFDKPRLFLDGEYRDIHIWMLDYSITNRNPPVRAYGNFILACWELLIRNPNAERFAIFQDDFVTYPYLREYLESCEYPKKGYWNLYTFPENHKPEKRGWYPSNQWGRGAVALIFDNANLRFLLSQSNIVNKPLDCKKGYKSIDGAVITAFRDAGRVEYVHNPSLVQHTGDLSAIGNSAHRKSPCFNGEDFDARELIGSPTSHEPVEATDGKQCSSETD